MVCMCLNNVGSFRVCGYVSLHEGCVASFPVLYCCYRCMQYMLSILQVMIAVVWGLGMRIEGGVCTNSTVSRPSLLHVDAGEIQWGEGFFPEDAEVGLRVWQLFSLLHHQPLDSKATQLPSFCRQSQQREKQKCITQTQPVLKFESVHCLLNPVIFISFQSLPSSHI